jgi:hypothetical protein
MSFICNAGPFRRDSVGSISLPRVRNGSTGLLGLRRGTLGGILTRFVARGQAVWENKLLDFRRGYVY